MQKLFKNQYVVASMLSLILFGSAELSFAAAPDATQILPYNTKNSGVNPIPGRPTLVQQGLQTYFDDSAVTGSPCLFRTTAQPIPLTDPGTLVSGMSIENVDRNVQMWCPANTVMAGSRFYVNRLSRGSGSISISYYCCPTQHKFDEVK